MSVPGECMQALGSELSGRPDRRKHLDKYGENACPTAASRLVDRLRHRDSMNREYKLLTGVGRANQGLRALPVKQRTGLQGKGRNRAGVDAVLDSAAGQAHDSKG